MQWKLDNAAPIYAQLVDQLKMRIITGVYPMGSRMPAVRELAVEAGVNPNTMQRALQELERQGLVYTQRTSGRFVTENSDTILGEKEKLAGAYVKTFLAQMSMLGFGQKEILDILSREEIEKL